MCAAVGGTCADDLCLPDGSACASIVRTTLEGKSIQRCCILGGGHCEIESLLLPSLFPLSLDYSYYHFTIGPLFPDFWLQTFLFGHRIKIQKVTQPACRYLGRSTPPLPGSPSSSIMEASPEGAGGVAALYVKHATRQWLSNEAALQLLKYLHFAYPLILLVFFITTFTAHSIIAANNHNDEEEQGPEEHTGPGGKALPKKKGPNAAKTKDVLDFSRPRKLLFEWLSLGATLTFLGNCITVVVHALYARDEQWWCGQATVVSLALPLCIVLPTT